MVRKQLKLDKCSLKGKRLFYMGDKVTEKNAWQSRLATRKTQEASLKTEIEDFFSLFSWYLKTFCSQSFMYLLFECPTSLLSPWPNLKLCEFNFVNIGVPDFSIVLNTKSYLIYSIHSIFQWRFDDLLCSRWCYIM